MTRATILPELLLRVDPTPLHDKLNVNLSDFLKTHQDKEKKKETVTRQCSTHKAHTIKVTIDGSAIGTFSRYILVQFGRTRNRKITFGLDENSTFELKDVRGDVYHFKIAAILMHRGDVNGGHYITMAPNEEEKIFVYNDDARFGPYDTFRDACNNMLLFEYHVSDFRAVLAGSTNVS